MRSLSQGFRRLPLRLDALSEPVGPTTPSFDPELGLTQTGTYPIGLIPSPPPAVRKNSIVFAADFTGLDVNGGGGMIAEFGGTGSGAYVGFDRSGGSYDNDLILRYGSGGSRWQTNTWYGVYPNAAFGPDGTLVVSFDFTNDTTSSARLFWNGEEVLPLETSGPQPVSNWAGTEGGGYLDLSSNVPDGENGVPITYTTASPMRTYAGQQVSI